MPVIKEYWCPAHGDFDGAEPTCPKGCSVGVERHFRTAPGLAFGVAKRTDHLLEGIAKEHGLSDMDNRGGRPARMLSQGDKMRAMQEAIAAKYGSTGWGSLADEKSGGAPATVQSMVQPGATPVNTREILADVPKPGITRIVDKRDPSGAAGMALVQKAAA
jgi:hypothetical protein